MKWSKRALAASVAMVAGALLVATAPSLFARGGGRGSVGDGGGDPVNGNGDSGGLDGAPPPAYGPNNISGNPNDPGGGMDAASREAAEQARISRDVMDRASRDCFAEARDARNRRAAESNR